MRLRSQTRLFSFIHSSSILSFIHPSVHSSIHSPFHSFIHLSIHSSIHSFVRSFIHPIIHSLIPDIPVPKTLAPWSESVNFVSGVSLSPCVNDNHCSLLLVFVYSIAFSFFSKVLCCANPRGATNPRRSKPRAAKSSLRRRVRCSKRRVLMSGLVSFKVIQQGAVTNLYWTITKLLRTCIEL